MQMAFGQQDSKRTQAPLQRNGHSGQKVLIQFMNSPTISHRHAVQKILFYAKRAPRQGITFLASSSLSLRAFCRLGCPDSRRSVSGYCVFFGQSLICFMAPRKNQLFFLSFAEAEYYCTWCEITWLWYLLLDLQVTPPQPTVFCCDNQAVIYIASHPVFYERTKHFELDCHLACDHIQTGSFRPFHVYSFTSC